MNTQFDTEQHTLPEMACRAFWMMLGPLLLVPLAFKIVEHGNGWLTVFDIMFLGIVAALLLARGFEFFKGHPRTAEGTPATPAHFRNYALGVIAIGALVWIVTNVLGNYVFTS